MVVELSQTLEDIRTLLTGDFFAPLQDCCRFFRYMDPHAMRPTIPLIR